MVKTSCSYVQFTRHRAQRPKIADFTHLTPVRGVIFANLRPRLKSADPRLCLPLIVWVYLHSLLQGKLQSKVRRYGRSVSFKITEIGTNRKLCDFLFIFHCNCVHIFYSFRDITICWSKICACFAVFTNTSLVCSPRKGCSLGPRVWQLVSENCSSLRYRPTKDVNRWCYQRLSQLNICWWRTARQTTRQTDRHPAYS